MPQPKILAYFVSEDWYFRSHRLPIALRAIERGYDVHLIARLSGAAGELRERGLTLHDYNIGRGTIDAQAHRQHLSNLRSILGELQPTVLHNVAMKPVIYGSLAATRTGTSPWTVNALGGLGYIFSSGSKRARALRIPAGIAIRKALRANPGRLIVQNEDDARTLLSQRIVDPSALVMIRGSGVDTAEFQPHQSTRTIPVVAFAGRFLLEKGVREYVEAVRILHDRGVRARFVMLGGPDPENPSSIGLSTIADLAGTSPIEIWGWRNEMHLALKDVDVMVLPSYREGLPKSLIEAAASGLPIVTTDAPGCRDVVSDGLDGYLVPVRSSPHLADAIATLVDSAELRQSLGAAGRRKAVEEFSLEDVVASTMALYEQGEAK